MATKIADRSTYWAVSEGPKVNNVPDADGDHRYYWKIYYEQTDDDKKPWNNRSKVIVEYYIQTHKLKSVYADIISYPSGTSTTKINNSILKSFNTPSGDIVVGDNYRLKYIGESSKYIYHNETGDATFTWQGSGFGMGTAQTTYSLPHIDRYSITSTIDTFEIDNGFSTTITKYVSSYYDKLDIIVNGEVVRTIKDAKDTINIVFTEAELNKIYALVPTGETTTFTIKLTTYTNSGMGTIVGTYIQTPIGRFNVILPTVNGAICTDSSAPADSYIALTGDSTMQTIIKNNSLIRVSIPTNMEAVANTRGSTIKEYVIEGLHVDYNPSGTSLSLTERDSEGNSINHEKYSQKDHIIIYAVDSRGTSSLPFIQKFTKYIPYEKLSFNTKTSTITRNDNGVGRNVTLSIEGTWWEGNFGAVENELDFVVYYRNAEDGYWTDLNEFIEGAEIGSIDKSLVNLSETGKFKYNGPVMSTEDDKGFDVENSYDVLFAVFDKITNFAYGITVEYGKPAIAVYKNKAALGGPYDEFLGGTQLWDNVYLDGKPLVQQEKNIVSAYLNYDWVNDFEAWTSYVVPFDTVNIVGDRLTFEDGSVIIGDGISKIKMSGSVFFSGDVSDTELRMWVRVKRADGSEFGAPSYGYAPTSGTNMLISTPPIIANVVPGERIDVIAQIGKTATGTILSRGTTIYVEVIE